MHSPSCIVLLCSRVVPALTPPRSPSYVTLLSRFTISLFIPSHDAARHSLVSVGKYKLTRSCVMCVCVILCECFGRLNNDSSPRIAQHALCCCVVVLFPHSHFSLIYFMMDQGGAIYAYSSTVTIGDSCMFSGNDTVIVVCLQGAT